MSAGLCNVDYIMTLVRYLLCLRFKIDIAICYLKNEISHIQISVKVISVKIWHVGAEKWHVGAEKLED